jgi:murein DD-endopeptidase MepM/ murein hydrolase activator NlpD
VSSRGPDGEDVNDPMAERANAILQKFDEVNLHRMATDMVPFYQPVQAAFRFTSPFGFRRDPKTGGRRMHNGTDFAAPSGTPLLAGGDGVVIQSGWAGGYGRMVTIQHQFGYTTRYAHMSRIRASMGQRVSRGDRIGDMGTSGRSTGSHLHYEVRLNGTPVNPMTFIRAGQNVF